jgi:hypothetical protein
MDTLILSMPRTGSSYLYATLCSLHEHTYAEPFRKVTDPIQFVNTMPDNVLIKSHYKQLNVLDQPTRDKFMDRDWNIIMLLRRNVFKMTISRALAIHTGEYRDFTYGQGDKFKLNIRAVMALFVDTLHLVADLVAHRSSTHNVMYYEDLTFVPVMDLATLNLPVSGLCVQDDRLRSPGMNVVDNIDILYDLCREYMETYHHPTIRYNDKMEITTI